MEFLGPLPMEFIVPLRGLLRAFAQKKKRFKPAFRDHIAEPEAVIAPKYSSSGILQL